MDAPAEYAQRLRARKDEARREDELSRRIGTARLLTGIGAAALAYFVFGVVTISPWWLLPPAILFAALVVIHARVDARLGRARRAAAFYEWGLARIEDHWMGRGERGDQFRNPAHVYADDLDLFGEGSLFELLCTARTAAGQEMLAHWLLAPANVETALGRQAAVAELRPGVDLREDFAVLGEPLEAALHPEALARWGEAPRVEFHAALRALAAALSGAVVLSFALYMAGVVPRTPFIAALLASLAFGFALRKRVEEVAEAVETPARELALLAEMLARMEREHCQAPAIVDLLQRIRTGELAASTRIGQLRRLMDRLEWTHNPFFQPIAAALLWKPQLAMAIEAWRAVSGKKVRPWIDAVAEFEALLALACYAYEHPADVFPEFRDQPGWFEAEGLGHPLIPEAQCVRNDVQLGGELRLLVVSGSNMSGKSTLLRSVGLNVVLAWAGAPVRSRRLALSPLALGASIRIVDSLQDGRSRFYAEITRLREIVELTRGPLTVLFLMDELLSGTNSHDRRIGAEAIVRTLVERGAIGMLTTHDLALAHIGDNLDGRARNVHFADTIEDGRLHFDYRLQPGVVRRSNALELMRSVGLEV